MNWPKFARRVRVPLGFAFAVLYLWFARPTGSSLASGTVFVAIGLYIRAVASGHIRKNQELTTTGPYAYTRNPLYLGSLILAVGFVWAARNWWLACIAVVFFVAVYVPVIRDEEHFLRSQFPEFELYARTVPRLLPRLHGGPLGESSFSWERYKNHREYKALLGAAAISAVLLLKLYLWAG